MDKEILKIEVTNYLTGEISEIEVKGGDAAANEYMKLKASAKAIDIALKKLLNYIDDYMGPDDKLPLGDGYTAVRQQREVRTWTKEALKKTGLDEDAIDIISRVNMTLAKEVVKEAIERGEIAPNSVKTLNESAEVNTSKPFVQLR